MVIILGSLQHKEIDIRNFQRYQNQATNVLLNLQIILSIISFDTVFKSFELGIKYDLHYLRTRPEQGDIYYPHIFQILEGKPKFFQWNVAYYTKPIIPKEENIGCYFIYDNDGELVYIGKSNSNLYERACTSTQDRTKGNFLKIELYSMPTHADTNIYELYFIAKYKLIHHHCHK